MITVVNRKFYKGPGIYIGRPMPRLGLNGSLLANQYRIGKDGTRDECCDKYEIWFNWRLESDPSFVAYIDSLVIGAKEGKDLIFICWCKPERCHGDFIKSFIENKLWGN